MAQVIPSLMNTYCSTKLPLEKREHFQRSLFWQPITCDTSFCVADKGLGYAPLESMAKPEAILFSNC